MSTSLQGSQHGERSIDGLDFYLYLLQASGCRALHQFPSRFSPDALHNLPPKMVTAHSTLWLQSNAPLPRWL